jgi:hypothetical protein
MKLCMSLLAAAGSLFAAASANVTVLDFEDVADYPNDSDVLVQNFYNGGTASNGNVGPNLGVSMSDNALLICLNTVGTFCSNTSHGGLNDGSERGGLFFLSGSEAIMNVAAGFDTGFAFKYTAINSPGLINVYDGLNGTGNVLASIQLNTTPSTCGTEYSAAFCPFADFGVAFMGTALSVDFAGVANQIVFDDITFGSINPGGDVPVPAAAPLMLAGLGAIAARRKAKKK